MMEVVLEVENLSKTFRTYRSEWHRVASWFGASPKLFEEHTVLDCVSFKLLRGQAVGLVGVNGAGKSTLLKLITGTHVPTNGDVVVKGHISAILELGLGFNSELSGRQNVYRSAGLMGLGQRQITDLTPAIEEFAEIGEYFDEPMRTYSSGMQMRVAFSLATAIRPDILIVDEALSVGDAHFQHKCFSRIRQFQQQGTSLLFVSHDSSAIKSLCSRAIILDQGKIVRDGPPSEVMDFYTGMVVSTRKTPVDQSSTRSGHKRTVSGSKEISLSNITITNVDGSRVENVHVGEDISITITARTSKYVQRLVMGFMLKDRVGNEIFGTNTEYSDQVVYNVNPDQTIIYNINLSANLGPGSYSISTAFVSDGSRLDKTYEWHDLACVFSVSNVDKQKFIGTNWLATTIEVQA